MAYETAEPTKRSRRRWLLIGPPVVILVVKGVNTLVQLGLTFGIFFTPVFWEPAMLGPTWAPIAMLNPLAPILEGLRLAVMEGHDLLRPLSDAAGVTVWSPWHLAYSAATAVIGGTIAILAFHRAEFILAEHV